MTSDFWKREKKKTQESINNLMRSLRIIPSTHTKTALSSNSIKGRISPAVPQTSGSFVSKTPNKEENSPEVEIIENSHAEEVLEGEGYVAILRKLQNDISNLRHTYNLPRNIDGDRLTYDEVFPERGDKKCPNCGYDFEKSLQRAKRCPKCQEYLRVRYGHLLTDKDDEYYHRQMRLATLCWAYEIGGPQYQSIELLIRSDCDNLAKENIKKFYEDIAAII